VIIGQSISGGAATIAAATAPDLISGVIELAPFTRAVSYSIGGLLGVKRHRSGTLHLGRTLLFGSLPSWKKYLDLAYPTKPADWAAESARIDAKLSEPGRMKALQAMCKTKPVDAGAALSRVRCPVLVIEGALDPDWADPRAEGEGIIAALPTGTGELVVLEGVGHYAHAQVPDELVARALPFLATALPRA
jgi:pimeloyl-ACP methyl ester carboxylesterase